MIRVLHVEDNQNDIELLRLQFMRESDAFSITGATSVERALELFEQKNFDCIICDIRLPGKSGLEMLQAVRSAGHTVPFIFLTGQGNEETAAEALRMGASEYYIKESSDYSAARLRSSIRRHVEAHELQLHHEREMRKKQIAEDKVATLLEALSKPACIIDSELTVHEHNRLFFQQIPAAEKELPYSLHSALPNDGKNLALAVSRASLSGEPDAGQLSLRDQTGSVLTFEIRTAWGDQKESRLLLTIDRTSDETPADGLKELLEEERRSLKAVTEKFRGQLSDRIKFEKIFMFLHDLAESQTTIKDSKVFYHRVCSNLATLINTENIYIALHEKDSVYSFPYVKDHFDDESEEQADLSGSLTDYVFRTGEPLLATEKQHEEMIRRGDVDQVVGASSKIWMGVPLKSDSQLFGVLAMQSYSDENAFTYDDLDLLTIVSNQFALAIQKRITEDQLMLYQVRLEERVRDRTRELQNANMQLQQEIELRTRSEQLLSTLYNLSRLAVNTHSLTEMIAAIEEEMEKLLGNISMYIAYSHDEQSGAIPYLMEAEADPPDSRSLAHRIMDNITEMGQVIVYNGKDSKNIAEHLQEELSRQRYSWMGTPLYSSDGVRGGIVLRRIDQDDSFTNAEFTLFTSAALNLAQSLEKRIIDDDRGLLLQFLKEKNQQLSSLNDELEAFSYSVSHDLRKPIRHISGFAGLLKDLAAERDDNEVIRLVDRINSACISMNRLVEDLLTLSRINRVEISRKTINLSAVCKSVVHEMEENADKGTLELKAPDELTVHAEPSLVRVMMQNMLENAWKFTRDEENPQVELFSTEENGKHFYGLRDNGKGFDQKKVKEIFAPFVRLHSDSEVEGTGIGLATVARIINRHGGEIRAEGRPGEGATFLFRLQ